MKKLESLKLEKFRQNQISDLSIFDGGQQYEATWIQTYSQTSETHFDWMLGHSVTNTDTGPANDMKSSLTNHWKEV